MSIVVYVSVLICSITIAVNLLLLYCWTFKRKSHSTQPGEWPKVSILVAARDEAHNIAGCLQSLIEVDYPPDCLEILVGDDQSRDKTYDLAQAFEAAHAYVHLMRIENNLGKAKGKANVLAHLARKATGSVYLIADADVTVPATWVKEMLSGLKENVGIVNGFTSVADNQWQNTDWVFALGMVKVITDLGQPVTAMGNNMLVTKNAYESVGGYESIPFSITEDFELFKQVRKKGFDVVQLAKPEITAKTKSQQGFAALLNQRKRWMRGAVQLPWPIVLLLAVQAFYFPALIALIVIDPLAASTIFLFKSSIQAAFIARVREHLKIRIPLIEIFIYEFYSLVVAMGTALFYLLPVSITWKGRKY